MVVGKSPAQIGYALVQKETAELVRPLGFKRKGAILFKKSDDNFGVLHFQSSSASSKDEIIFTLNVGVIIGKLADPREYSQLVRHPSSIHSQIRERIGFLLPEREDTWWKVSKAVNVPKLSADFSRVVFEKAVPFIERYMKPENVLSDWERGISPGLTERETVEYLARLRKLIDGSGGSGRTHPRE
jgi:hypothetical protein